MTSQTFTYSLDPDPIDIEGIKREWNLPISIIQRLDSHYLLYWNTSYLIEAGLNVNGVVLIHQGKPYITVVDDSDSGFATSARTALSFRHPTGTNFGWVIIRPALNRSEH